MRRSGLGRGDCGDKTVSGTRVTLGGDFQQAYKQGLALLEGHPGITEHSVFIRLKSDLPLMSVMSKIAGELKGRTGQGQFMCYFEASGELHNWTYDELRAIIGKKHNPEKPLSII